MESMRPELDFLLSLAVNGQRKLGKLLFALEKRKKNLNRSISNKETDIVVEALLSQKASQSEKILRVSSTKLKTTQLLSILY